MKTVKQKYLEAWELLDNNTWDYFRNEITEKDLNFGEGEVWEAFLEAERAYIEFSNTLQRKAGA